MFFLFYFYIFHFIEAGDVPYNDQCINCYRENRMNFNDFITRHLYESMISKNLSLKTSADVFSLKAKCKGAIVTFNMALTSASYFDNKTEPGNYAVYVGYQILIDNKNFRMHGADKIYLHPDFIIGNDSDNIALVKVKTKFLFTVSGSTIGLLPDNPIDLVKTKSSKCTILTHRVDASGKNILQSLEIQLLTKEECTDLVQVNNLTFSLVTSSFCVRVRGPYKYVDIALGTTFVCKGRIRGIITQPFKQLKTQYPIPVVDVGLYSGWIRAKIVNLNQVSSASLKYYNVMLFTILYIFKLKCYYN